MFKLLLSWDVLPNQDQQYFEFMVREFTPRLTALGITPIEAWFTLYGDESPQIVMEGMTEDLDVMRTILATPEWNTLKDQLLEYVTNFNQKVIRGRSHLQL
jgi:hypothetical protein